MKHGNTIGNTDSPRRRNIGTMKLRRRNLSDSSCSRKGKIVSPKRPLLFLRQAIVSAMESSILAAAASTLASRASVNVARATAIITGEKDYLTEPRIVTTNGTPSSVIDVPNVCKDIRSPSKCQSQEVEHLNHIDESTRRKDDCSQLKINVPHSHPIDATSLNKSSNEIWNRINEALTSATRASVEAELAYKLATKALHTSEEAHQILLTFLRERTEDIEELGITPIASDEIEHASEIEFVVHENSSNMNNITAVDEELCMDDMIDSFELRAKLSSSQVIIDSTDSECDTLVSSSFSIQNIDDLSTESLKSGIDVDSFPVATHLGELVDDMLLTSTSSNKNLNQLTSHNGNDYQEHNQYGTRVMPIDLLNEHEGTPMNCKMLKLLERKAVHDCNEAAQIGLQSVPYVW